MEIGKEGNLLNQLLKLEEAFGEYELTGVKLDDTIKFAVLMRCVTGQLKTWLQLNVAETQDYSRLREAIVQYDNATLKWNNAMMLGQETNRDGAVPMKIDRITEKGKGGKKGKGKGEQKGGKQGGKWKGQQKGQDHGGGGKGQQKGSWKQESGKGSGQARHLPRDWTARAHQVTQPPQ